MLEALDLEFQSLGSVLKRFDSTVDHNEGRFVLWADPLHEYTLRLRVPYFGIKTGSFRTGGASSPIALGDIVVVPSPSHGYNEEVPRSSLPTHLSRQPGLSGLIAVHVEKDFAIPGLRACLEMNALRLEDGLRVSWLELMENGNGEVLFEGRQPCFTATHNVPMLLYRQHDGRWQLILRTEGRRLERLSTRTGSRCDIAVHRYASAQRSSRILFQYQAGRYVPHECEQTLTFRWDTGEPMIEKVGSCPSDWKVLVSRRSN